MRFETFMFHLDLPASDAVLSGLWQLWSLLWQNSRRCTVVKLAAATRANTNSVWRLDISTD